MTPKGYFFDMDHTVIGVDSDVTWKSFSVSKGLCAPDALERSERYFEEYNAGTLDFLEFLRFQISEFVGNPVEKIAALCQEHFEQFVRPMVYAEAFELVGELKKQHIPTVLLTATNTTIARPIAEYFGFDSLIGTELEVVDGRYTGNMSGIYAAKEGKVVKAEEECRKRNLSLAEIAYYGDSINDFNILAAVGRPVATNPSDALRAIALQKHWEILDFHKKETRSL